MLEAIASSSFAFWSIAALIVVIDSVVLLTPGEFVFAFNRHGKPVVRAAATPYLVRNKDLSFAALVFFARPFFVSSATVPQVRDDELAALARQASQHRSIYLYSAVTVFLLIAADELERIRHDAAVEQALVQVDHEHRANDEFKRKGQERLVREVELASSRNDVGERDDRIRVENRQHDQQSG